LREQLTEEILIFHGAFQLRTLVIVWRASKFHARKYNRFMIASLIGVAGAGALVAAGYQSMAPTGQWYGKTFTGLVRGSNKLALTYDDGPNDPHTLRLLEVLARYQAKATFFLIGQYVEARPDIVRAIVAAGHSVGNHTFTHPNLIFSSPSETRDQLERCSTAIEQACGVRVNLFRPPFGGRLPKTLRIARSLQLEPIMWNVAGRDWNAPSADYIEQKIATQIRGGDVILLHDGSHKGMGADRAQTVLATEKLIARYKSEAYEFLTIDAMRETVSPPSSLSRQEIQS
jgi:peptidoglycan/xylan/chitin deacetylase (PgdA/CDA1 family)